MEPIRFVEARCEKGLLKPTKPLPLRPGERVNLYTISSVMNVEEMAQWLEQRLPARVPGHGLSPGTTRVRYVMNWGGFVNHSFHVCDGPARFHLKLSDDGERLRAWRDTHEILERRHHAPALIQWVEFPEIGYAGLLQRHVDGATARLQVDRALLMHLIETANRLHHDPDLRSYLAAVGTPRSRLDYFVETYIHRFASDLEIIDANRPAFISGALFAWMQSEVVSLQRAAALVTGFHDLAEHPVHGDLHEGNVLVGDEWFIVDWDDLSLGDPAVEFAILLWPLVNAAAQSWQTFLPSAGNDFSERIAVAFRAQLLDAVIDTVADYVEAAIVPARQEEIRAVKRREHETALERYKALAGRF
jgi:predicted DNA-binding antitoxin AbrB/MazE fold protein